LLTGGSERARLARERRTSSASLRVCPFELHDAGEIDVKLNRSVLSEAPLEAVVVVSNGRWIR
jgi:hypothetical protein